MKKLLFLLLSAMLMLPVMVNAQFTATFGTGTSSTTTGGAAGAPMSYGGAYSWCQQIYRAAEFTAANVPAGAVITAIEFYNATGATTMSDLRTYMGPRSTDYFSGTSDWAPYNTLTLVDSGDWVTTGTGWFSIQLDQPYIWDGTSNLVVGVSFRGAHSDYSTNNPNCGYQYTAQSGNAHIRRYSTTLSSCDPMSTAAANSVSSARPNLRISYVISGCPSLTPMVANIGPYSADLNWLNYNQSALSFDLVYGEASTFDTLTGTTITSLTDTFYSLTGLTSATTYKACIKSHCSSESGTWSAPRVFTTLAACPTPVNLAVGGITATSVTVNWAPGATETSWELSCVPHGSAAGSGTSEYPTAYPYTVNNLNPNTQYDVYVRANCGNGEWSYWTSAVTFTTDPVCTPPTNVVVDQISGSSALVSWYSAPVGADSYTVEYSEHGMNNWVPATVSVTHYMLSGLTPETSYDVRVFSNCQLGDADTVSTSFTTECLVMDKVCFEDGTAGSSYIPVSNSSNYSFSQQLFLASELNNAPMDIKKIAFEYKYSTAMTAKTNVDIYLGHTAQNSFVTNTSWVTYSNLQKVYTGSLNCHQGWNTFVLDSTFHYNGVDNLVLVLDDNSGSSNGSTSYTFAYKSQSPNYMSLYYYNASTNPDPQSPPTATTRSQNRNNVRFLSECDLTTTCVAPNVYVTGVTESSVTLDWAPGNNESSWQLEYSTDDTTWIQEGTVTTSPYTISNLTANTDYTIRMRSICGSSEFSNWTFRRISTPCVAATLPVTENFDAAVGSSTGNMVDCWGTLTNYTASYPFASTSYHHSGTHSAYFYGTSAYYSYLISPRMDDAVQMNNIEVTFWGYKTSADYFIQVGVMSDPDDPNTFEQIGSNITPSATSTWERFEFNTSLYTGQGKYIAFRTPGNVADYMYVDDIDIHVLPTCPHVTNIHTVANTVTANSADLVWTPGGTENEWIVVYGITGTITNPDNELATATTVYTAGISLTGLIGGSSYDVYVKSLCNAGDSSVWMQYSFRTECGYISQFPYMENFEGFNSGSSNTIYCWTRNGLYSSSSYPYVSTSYSTSGTKSLYFYVYTNSTYSTYASIYSSIALPPVDTIVPVNTLEMSFKMRTSNVTGAKMIVGVMTNPSNMSTFTPVQTLAVSTANTFESFNVDFSNYTGSGSYIAFKTNFTSSYNAYVDDIHLNVIPTCRRPIDVTVASTSNSATINWTARNNESDWQVVVVPHGQPVTSGTPEYVNTHPYTVLGLTDATAYDVYVKADCGGGDESDWSDVVAFRTKCMPVSTIPYYESFETAGTGTTAFPACWTKYSTYTSGTQPYVNSSYHSEGSAALYFYMPSSYYMYAASQALDLSNYNAGDLAFSYKLMPYSSLSYARMDVGIMTNPDDPATFTLLRSHYPGDFTATNTWYSFSIPLTQTYSTPIYIAFKTPVSSTTTYMYLDEVKVDVAPTCSAPTNLEISNIAGASALVSWTASQYGDGDYTVEYSDDNINWNTVTVTGTSVMLSGLTQQTLYHVHVYRNCTSGNSDILSGTFTTGCNSSSDVAFADGTTTTYYVPVYNSASYKYSYTQQIYLASEMGGTPMDIQSIAFEYKYSTPLTSRTNVSIYLGHTTKSTFSSTTDWVPYSDLQLVYSGNLNCTMGWNTFVLDSVFHYNGTSNLVVAVDDNSNAYSGTSYVFAYKTQSPNYRTMYYYNASTNPDPQNPTTASSRSYYRNNIKFLTPCDNTVTCIAPNAYVSARDHESIEVTWAPGGTETAWEFEYKPANATSWTQVQGATSPQVLNGLTSNTVYNIRLRSDCGNNYSEWRNLTAETECPAITVPYMQNFDSTTAGTGAMVPCWTRATNYSTAYPYLSTTYSESTPNAVYFYATSAYYSYIASPRFDDSTVMDSLLIRFKARKTATTPYFIEVGIMTDPNDYNTFMTVGTYAPNSNSDFESAEVKTDGYSGTGKYVAFRCPQWIANYMYIDDVQIDYIPNCLHPENVHAVATSITAYSADVTWTPGGDEMEWSVVYGPAGTITDPNLMTQETVYGTPSISLTGLSGTTLYEVFVQGHCSNGENSVWESGSFRTACAPITTLPYVEDFESYTAGSSSSQQLPSCWASINYGTTATGCPTVNSNTTYAYGKCLYFYSTTASGFADQIAILPEIDVNTLPMNTLRLKFDARRYQTTTTYVDYVEIGVLEGTSTFVPVDTVTFTSTTISTHHVDFFNYSGTGNRIAIRAPKPTGSYTTNYTYLDNVKIVAAPSCPDIMNFHVASVTSSTVDLAWTDGASESNWEVLLIPANQTPDYTQAQPVTSNSYSEANLNPNTMYTAYVRTVCSNGLGYNEWASVTFMTSSANPAQLPYFHDFDDGTENAEWVILNSSRPNKWYIGMPSGATDSMLYISNDNGATNSYTIASENTTIWAYRDVQFGPGAEFDIKFNWRCYGEGSYDFLKVYVGTPTMVEAKTTSSLYNTTTDDPVGVLALEPKFNLNSAWTTYVGTLPSSFANSVQRIYFRWTNDGSAGTTPPAAVDSIFIISRMCGHPDNLAASNVTTSTADITFTPALSTDNAWEYVYSTSASANPDALTPNSAYTTTISLSGLSASTTYYVYVRTDCGGGEYSSWTQQYSFTTTCGALTLPYTENFDNMGSGSGTLPNCWNGMNTYSTTTLYPYISTSYHTSGNASLYFYCSTATYNIAVLPPVDATTNPINTLQLSFMMRSSSAITSTITVGVMTDPANANTFTPVATVNNTVTGTFEFKEVNLSNYTGTGTYVALKLTNTGGTYAIYLDDLVLETIPSCPRPQNVTVSNPSQNSLTLSWAAGSAQSWTVEYGLAGFTQGTGATVQVQGTPTTTITGLTSSSTYDFYVQADCGSGDVSAWSFKVSGSTLCDVVTALPYTENFDSYGTGTTAYPNCWSKINTYTSGERPYCYSSYAYGGSAAGLYFYTSGTMYNIAITPEFDATIPVNTLKAKFMFRGNSSSSGYVNALQVGVMTNPMDATTFVPVDTVYAGSTPSTYESREVSFSNYTGTGHFIAFKNGLLGGSYYYAAIDNLVIELDSNATPPTPPTCQVPTGLTVPASSITQTTASATWNAGGTETAWDLQYKQHNATSWGNAIALTARSYNFTGLTDGTQYDVRVRANCGNDGYSDWTTAVTFQTATQSQNPCEDPTGLTASNMTTNSVVLDWTENGTSTSWTVNYQESGVAQWSTATANEHPYTLTGLQPATTYQAYVVANCDDGPSGVSNMVTFTTEGTGITDYELATSLYPNPNNGQFTINNEQFTIKNVDVYDVYGKLLKTVEVNANSVMVDANELSAGMYFVRISTEKGVVTKSFVKK